MLKPQSHCRPGWSVLVLDDPGDDKKFFGRSKTVGTVRVSSVLAPGRSGRDFFAQDQGVLVVLLFLWRWGWRWWWGGWPRSRAMYFFRHFLHVWFFFFCLFLWGRLLADLYRYRLRDVDVVMYLVVSLNAVEDMNLCLKSPDIYTPGMVRGSAGVIRVGTGAIRGHPWWHRGGPCWVRGHPCYLRGSAGMVRGHPCWVRGDGRLSFFGPNHPGPWYFMIRGRPGWSMLIRDGPAFNGTGALTTNCTCLHTKKLSFPRDIIIY